MPRLSDANEDQPGRQVRARRLEKGLTQAALAERAGISRRHLAHLERGANVSVDLLMRVCAALDLSAVTIGPVRVTVPLDRQAHLDLEALAQRFADVERAVASLKKSLGIKATKPRGARLPQAPAITAQ
jgi:transcriptional regulator with XRE-family HTH domain